MIPKKQLAVAALCAALACSRQSDAPISARERADSAVEAQRATDGQNTLALIQMTMAADSTISAAILNRTTRPDVRGFALATMREAHQVILESEEMSRKTGISPVLPPNDAASNDVAITLSLINGGSKTTNVDGLYLSGLVSRDLSLASLTTLKSVLIKNADLKAFFAKTAVELQRRVGLVAALEKKSRG
jgi:hypothetical protein